MAETPKNVQVTITPVVDTSALDQLKAAIQNIGEGFAKVGEQMKPAFEGIGAGLVKTWDEAMPSMAKQQKITAEQICAAYGVPPEMIGLLPPDAGSSILDGIKHGTLTSEIPDWDGEVLPMGTCPSNGSPYVPGHLGATAYLVNAHAPSPSTWEGKTPVQIMADIEKAAQAYKGTTVPKKTWSEIKKKPDSIPAHEVFTSALIHDQATVEETAKKLLKATGDVKVQKLDETGNPTGDWVTLGQMQDFNLESLSSMVAKSQLKAEAEAEKKLLGTYLGVDLSADSGNVVLARTSPADPDNVQISVEGPHGEPIKQEVLSHQQISDLLSQVKWPSPLEVGAWNHDWQHPIGKLGDHDYVELGHEEAVAEALAQKKKLDGLQTKLASQQTFNVMGKATPVVVTGVSNKVSQTMHLPNGATLIEYPDGISTVDLPGEVHTPGAMWSHKLHGKFSLPTEEAKKLVGLLPLEPGDSLDATTQWVSGKPFVWHPDHGWIPKDASSGLATPHMPEGASLHFDFEPDPAFGENLLASFPHVTTAKGGIKYPTPYDDVPEGFYVKEDPEHGEILVKMPEASAVSTAPEQLFDPVVQTPVHPQAHLWCTACEVHWMAHTGDPVACESGGYLRPSTPLEDKQYVTRQQMLKETGLK